MQPLGGSLAGAPATSVRDDGAAIVAGYRAVAGTSVRDPGYGRFLVMPKEVFERYSDLQTYSFDAYAQGIASAAGEGHVARPGILGVIGAADEQHLGVAVVARPGSQDDRDGGLALARGPARDRVRSVAREPIGEGGEGVARQQGGSARRGGVRPPRSRWESV